MLATPLAIQAVWDEENIASGQENNSLNDLEELKWEFWKLLRKTKHIDVNNRADLSKTFVKKLWDLIPITFSPTA